MAKGNYGKRQNGTLKGKGYFGVLKNAKGQTVTEYSIGVNIGGKEKEIPSIVPTLRRTELHQLVKTGKVTNTVANKAVAHAKKRIAAGKDPFAGKKDVVGMPGTKVKKRKY